MDVTTIASALTSIKTSVGILKGIRELNASVDINTKVIELQNEILNVQSNLMQMQISYSELIQENEELRSKVIEKLE